MSIALGQDTGVIAPESLKVAVIDTTVMHKVLRQMHRNLGKVCEAIVDQRAMEQRSERLSHSSTRHCDC